jgi:hypothetical protein
VGIGVPSKYLDLPLLSLGRTATVTLNRARRVRPQRTKNVRKTWSREERMPRAKAAAAGASPKDIYEAKELVELWLTFPKAHLPGPPGSQAPVP